MKLFSVKISLTLLKDNIMAGQFLTVTENSGLNIYGLNIKLSFLHDLKESDIINDITRQLSVSVIL
jgi:hypothetical protein